MKNALVLLTVLMWGCASPTPTPEPTAPTATPSEPTPTETTPAEPDPTDGQAPTPLTTTGDDEATADDACYQQCLKDNQAVSTAWEIIERNCKTSCTEGQNDPLQLKRP